VLAAADHEGDVRLYNLALECTELLDQGHNNIVNAVEFVSNEQGKLCISGGFDCKLLHWKIDEEDIVREIDLQELFTKQEVENTSMPFIYHIYRHKTTLFATTETGHVISYPTKDLKKHKYILKASLARVVQVKVPELNENLMVCLSRDGTFSLFDHTKRANGAPLFLQKYKCVEEPNWIEVMGN
jgi:WD40 repeat protein